MNIESIVQSQNGCGYFAAVSSAERILKFVYRNDAEKLAEIKTGILELRLKNENNQDKCPLCKIQMEIFDYDDCKLCCPECGCIVNTDNSYSTTPDGYIYKPKKPEFKPHKHFAQGLDQIFGHVIPKDVDWLKTVRQYIAQNNICEFNLETLRKILKHLKLSEYCKYTSYLIVELTGVWPPNISKEYLLRAHSLFKLVIKAREKIREENPSFGSNNPQYQYLIYKIFDVILPPDDKENRRIFHFIHLPGESTLKKRNKEWDIVWGELNKFVSEISSN